MPKTYKRYFCASARQLLLDVTGVVNGAVKAAGNPVFGTAAQGIGPAARTLGLHPKIIIRRSDNVVDFGQIVGLLFVLQEPLRLRVFQLPEIIYAGVGGIKTAGGAGIQRQAPDQKPQENHPAEFSPTGALRLHNPDFIRSPGN
jgi:hypothetical protein